MSGLNFENLEQMLASVCISAQGIIGTRLTPEIKRELQCCIDDIHRKFAKADGTTGIGILSSGMPTEVSRESETYRCWPYVSPRIECILQMHVEHENGIYFALTIR